MTRTDTHADPPPDSSGAAALIREMRAKVEEAAAQLDELTAELHEAQHRVDDLETVLDLFLQLTAQAIVVVDAERRMVGLSGVASEMLGGGTELGSPAALPPGLAGLVDDWHDQGRGEAELAVDGWSVRLLPLPTGGVVLLVTTS